MNNQAKIVRMESCDVDKHSRRIKRMLSKYGELKPEVNPRSSNGENEDTNSDSFELRERNSDEVDSIETQNNFDFFADSSLDCEQKCTESSTRLVISNPFSGSNVSIAPPTYNFNRAYKNGFIWKWTGFKFESKLTKDVDGGFRPFFTFWLIILQTIILLYSLIYHGFGDVGIFQKKISDVVWHQTNSHQPATYYEHPNIWIGPRTSALIRLGASFAPCMRPENLVMKNINETRLEENQSGCCIRLDQSGCAQTLHSRCSIKTSKFIKWSDKPGPVCGEDPRYCLDQNSSVIGSSISEWHNCRHYNTTSFQSDDIHMKCAITARPCCIGIYGNCLLSSKEYCEFMKGKYHRKATICSQVNCMGDACGLSSFKDDQPNQLYRPILSLFLHAGVIQYAITISIEYIYMRRLEKLLGTLKICFLFFISGLGGHLASLIFLPLLPQIGPYPALSGMLSFLLYEIGIHWKYFKYPWRTLSKVSLVLIVLLLVSLFIPWIDFFSNFFGFMYGLCTLFLIRPSYNENGSKESKSSGNLLKQALSITFLVLITSILIFLFCNAYLIEPILTYTKYLNCIPITSKWCSSMDITYKVIKALN